MENAEVARLFRELADLLEIEGANRFRVRAYRTAARTVETHPESITDLTLHHPERLTGLPGVGDDLAGKIGETVRTGRLHALDEAAKRVPRTRHDGPAVAAGSRSSRSSKHPYPPPKPNSDGCRNEPPPASRRHHLAVLRRPNG